MIVGPVILAFCSALFATFLQSSSGRPSAHRRSTRGAGTEREDNVMAEKWKVAVDRTEAKGELKVEKK